jgi:hypothetical protein
MQWLPPAGPEANISPPLFSMMKLHLMSDHTFLILVPHPPGSTLRRVDGQPSRLLFRHLSIKEIQALLFFQIFIFNDLFIAICLIFDKNIKIV